jgi:hypothetical protein
VLGPGPPRGPPGPPGLTPGPTPGPPIGGPVGLTPPGGIPPGGIPPGGPPIGGFGRFCGAICCGGGLLTGFLSCSSLLFCMDSAFSASSSSSSPNAVFVNLNSLLQGLVCTDELLSFLSDSFRLSKRLAELLVLIDL